MEIEVKLPIFGFEDLKKGVLIQLDDFFYRLEFDNGISFILIDPKKLRDYRFEIPKSYQKYLSNTEDEDIQILTIVTVVNPIEESTINFLAPFVINKKDKTILQIVLDENKYSEYGLREPIKKYL